MMRTEKDSRVRARELLAAINGAVDGVMTMHGIVIPDEETDAVFARAKFLDKYASVKVGDHALRATYIHLHETLGDMSAEPIPMDTEYEERVELFLVKMRTV